MTTRSSHHTPHTKWLGPQLTFSCGHKQQTNCGACCATKPLYVEDLQNPQIANLKLRASLQHSTVHHIHREGWMSHTALWVPNGRQSTKQM